MRDRDAQAAVAHGPNALHGSQYIARLHVMSHIHIGQFQSFKRGVVDLGRERMPHGMSENAAHLCLRVNWLHDNSLSGTNSGTSYRTIGGVRG